MKRKLFARILCIVLCAVIVLSIILIAIPMLTGRAAEIAPETVVTEVAAEESECVSAEAPIGAQAPPIAVGAPADSDITLSVTSGYTYAGCQYAFWQTGADKPVWSTSDSNIAVIDANGVLTARKRGDVTVTCSENGKSAVCKLTVREASPLNLSAKSMELQPNETGVLISHVKTVRWYSSNHQVATVSGGTVRAVGTGYATITAYTDCSASTCLVHVEADTQDKGITLSMRSGTTYAGCQIAFGQTGASKPVWTSSDTAVAAIDQNGVLTAKKAGTVTVTCSENEKRGYCVLTVKPSSPVNLSHNTMTMVAGTTGILSSTAAGVKWSSSNEKVAVVSDGEVLAKGAGYTAVTAYTNSGASTCLVHVTDVPQNTGMMICVGAGTVYVGNQYAFWQTGADNPVWESSDTFVATINQNGVLTAKEAGVTTVCVREGNKVSTCKLTVLPSSPTGLTPVSVTVEQGKTTTLHCSTAGVKWYTSNKNVASVTNGVVTAKAVGYATVTAYTEKAASTCLVHVTEPNPTEPTPTQPQPTQPQPTQPQPTQPPEPTLRPRSRAGSQQILSTCARVRTPTFLS